MPREASCVSAISRAKQYLDDFYHDHGKPLCRFCSHSVDWKSSIIEDHLSSLLSTNIYLIEHCRKAGSLSGAKNTRQTYVPKSGEELKATVAAILTEKIAKKLS